MRFKIVPDTGMRSIKLMKDNRLYVCGSVASVLCFTYEVIVSWIIFNIFSRFSSAQLYMTIILTYSGNTRHYLARFRRKSKVTSRNVEIVDLSLLLLYHLSNVDIQIKYLEKNTNYL